MTDSSRTARVLLVEDDPISAAAVQQLLQAPDYTTVVSESGEAALEHLAAHADYDLLILDWRLPGISGLEVLKAIKSNTRLRGIPVIMNTSMAGKDFIRQGLLAGAYYYLAKPLVPDIFRAVVESAIDVNRPNVQVQANAQSLFAAMSSATFYCRTVAEARALAQGLSQMCPEPERVMQGLWELLLNAIEHGNLQISYAEKSRLVTQNLWMDEIEARLDDATLGQRRVEVAMHRMPQCLQFTIRDEGDGFDWSDYLDFSPERAFDAHGRGIAMAAHLSFDTLVYQGSGNTVVTSVNLAAPQGRAT